MTLRHATAEGAEEKHTFLDTIGGGLVKAYNWVSDKVSGAYHEVRDTITGVVSTVHDDVVGVVSGTKDIITHTQDTVKDTITGVSGDVQKSVGSVSNALGNLGMPLAIGAAAVAFIYLQEKK